MLLAALALMSREADVSQSLQAQGGADERPAAPPAVGHLIEVPLPIAGNSDQSVRAQIRRVLENRPEDTRPPVLVLEFGQSEEQTGAGSEFGRCFELARFLIGEELRGARTVAYVPHRLEGHALLAAMACQEVVMHEEAELGRAGDEGISLGKVEREAYVDIHAQRQTLPAAIAMGMLDPQLEVYRAKLKSGTAWILSDELESVRDEPGFSGYDTVIKRGEVGSFTADELRTKFGFISRVVSDRADLAAALKLSRLVDDPSVGGQWRAIRVDLIGPINARRVTELQRSIDDAMREAEGEGEPVNFICLWIDSPGGSAADSISLINYLEGLDRGRVYVAAYIPGNARADASTVAMACDTIAIHSDATLGGSGAGVLDDDEAADLVQRIREITKARSGQWSLWAAMVDRTLTVYRYNRQGTDQVAYFCEAELDEQRDKDQWEMGDEVVDDQTLLKVEGAQAQDLGLAAHAVADFGEFRRTFGLEDEPQLVRRNWAHFLIDSMRGNWFLPWFLMFIGSFALIAELSSPGVGVGGFIALVCFALFFWLKVLDDTATGLEILLFIVGVGCIAVEVFLLPGFGVFGIGGGVLVIIALVLMSQTFVIPRNEYQLEQLPYSLFTVVAAGAGVFAGISIMRRYAEHTPGLRSVILAPPSDDEQEQLNRREALANFVHLRGKRGTTVTQLTPSGKARFGDDLIDVITDGEVVPKETDVVVVEVHGNIVVVEPVQ